MAAALGISEGMVSRLRRRGMPMDTVERAQRWRNRHLEPARMKGMRVDTLPARTAPTTAADEELRALMEGCETDTDLPEGLLARARALLGRLTLDRFLDTYRSVRGGWVVWQCLPATVSEWDNWPFPEDDDPYDDPDFEPISFADMALLQAVASGAATFAVDMRASTRPRFRDCVVLAGGQR